MSALHLRISLLGDTSMESDASNCPQCEARLLQAPRPLKRIFGDVRAFECASCGWMTIEYAFERSLPKFADAAE
jgi:hypothetical protein